MFISSFKSGRQGISTVMRKVLTWYAQYFNHRHRRRGHLFENRYKSVLCDEETYLLALVRYIHLNPVRARMVSTIRVLVAMKKIPKPVMMDPKNIEPGENIQKTAFT